MKTLTVSQIAEVLNRSQSTIRRWIADYELLGDKFVASIENVEKLGNEHGVGNMSGGLIVDYVTKGYSDGSAANAAEQLSNNPLYVGNAKS